MQKQLLLYFLILGFGTGLLAQRRASVWHFGHHAGLDFNGSIPLALADGQINTEEGVASICDSTGRLLFYTEGTIVWNANHQVMPNGTGLFGHQSTTQSALIVPKINDPERYYVFTLDQLGQSKGLNYSIVNMSLDGGDGAVELKNQQLQAPACEKLTAVIHCNGADIWVIVHGYNSNAFYAFLVSASGISAPVISNAGTVISAPIITTIGCLKASPDGKKLAAATYTRGVELFDFDNVSGIVSNGGSLIFPSDPYAFTYGPYGVEFSSYSKFLYVAGDYTNNGIHNSFLLQYDVTLPDIFSIQSSKTVIHDSISLRDGLNFATLQAAPDGKIYLAEVNQPYVSAINLPDNAGLACQFVRRQITLASNTSCRYGLPGYIQSYWRPSFNFSGTCTDGLISFAYQRPSDVVAVLWDFGDPPSGAINFSTLDNPQHLYISDGLYTVKLIRYYSCGSDTISKQVGVGTVIVNLGPDSVLCGDNPLTLVPQVTGSAISYEWQDGSSGPAFQAGSTGLYWVEVSSGGGCKFRDSINLTFNPIPQFSLGNDINQCGTDPVQLAPNISATQYLWNTGWVTDSLHVSQSGLYWLELSLAGCTYRDSINVNFLSQAVVDLGKDTALCEGNVLTLDALNPGMNYLWQDNSTNSTYTVRKTGSYWVKVNDGGCITTDTIMVRFDLKPVFTLGKDFGICPEMNVTLQPILTKSTAETYLWSDGSSNPTLVVTKEGNYSLTITNSCGASSDLITVSKGVCKIYVPTAFSPNNDGRNDVFKAMFGENVVEFKLSVFNRWGELVFQSNDINKGWDGKHKRIDQGNQLFIWSIEYRTVEDANKKTMKGTVLRIQ